MKLKNIIALLLLFSLILSTATVFAAPVDDNAITVSDEDDDTDDEEDEKSETKEEEDEDEEEDEKDDDEEDDHDEHDDEDVKEAFEREVEIEEGSKELKIKSKLKNGGQEDEFEAEFKVDDEPELKLKYKSESETNETEFEYRIEFVEIIEFNENSNISGYDENDTIVSVYELDEKDWNDIVYSSKDINGVNVYTANATTSDGVFQLLIHISGSFAELNGSLITPNAVKIDVEIHDYQYEGNQTYLSLRTDIKTEYEFEVEEETDEETTGFAENESQLSIGNSDVNGFFSWIKTAQADGQTIDVLNSGLITDNDDEDDDIEPGEQKGIIYFTFDKVQPKDIIWDPKVGVVSQEAVSALNSLRQQSSLLENLPSFTAWIAVIGLISISVIFNRITLRRKKE